MSAYEEILEAVTYAAEEETGWWRHFHTNREARQMLKIASEHEPEEYEAIQLADTLNEELPIGQDEISRVYLACLDKLKKQLNNH